MNATRNMLGVADSSTSDSCASLESVSGGKTSDEKAAATDGGGGGGGGQHQSYYVGCSHLRCLVTMHCLRCPSAGGPSSTQAPAAPPQVVGFDATLDADGWLAAGTVTGSERSGVIMERENGKVVEDVEEDKENRKSALNLRGGDQKKERKEDEEMFVCVICPNIRRRRLSRQDLLAHLGSHVTRLGSDVVRGSDRNYSCDSCGYTNSSWKVKEHVASVHQGLKHTCPACGKTYNWRVDLKAHCKSAHGDTGYRCDLCSYTSPGKKDMGDHYRHVHDKNVYESRLDSSRR